MNRKCTRNNFQRLKKKRKKKRVNRRSAKYKRW